MIIQKTLKQLDEFFAPTKIAIVSTINKEGMPYLTPDWNL